MSKAAEVRREGEVVTIEVRCSEVYEAMQLYDELIAALEAGYLTLTVRSKAGERAEARRDRRQTGLF